MSHDPIQDAAIWRLRRQGATVRRVMVGYPNQPPVRSYSVTVTVERQEVDLAVRHA